MFWGEDLVSPETIHGREMNKRGGVTWGIKKPDDGLADRPSGLPLKAVRYKGHYQILVGVLLVGSSFEAKNPHRLQSRLKTNSLNLAITSKNEALNCQIFSVPGGISLKETLRCGGRLWRQSPIDLPEKEMRTGLISFWIQELQEKVVGSIAFLLDFVLLWNQILRRASNRG